MPPPRNAAPGRMPAAARALRWILFALLLGAAALTLLGVDEIGRAVAAGRWPRAALALPPAVLTVFIAMYAVYRLALVRAGRYPAGKALAQVGLMVLGAALVGGVVLEVAKAERSQLAGAPVSLAAPLRDASPAVRALAAEVARCRPRAEAVAQVPRLVERLDDADAEVRRQARATLVVLAGEDVGGEGPASVARWRAYWQQRLPAGQ